MPDVRHFTDARGLSWSVYEMPATHVELNDEVVEDRPAHLTFELASGGRMLCRQLRHYPADWRELAEAELEVLCNEAGPPLHLTHEEAALGGQLEDLST
jgi:hypothetical protein